MVEVGIAHYRSKPYVYGMVYRPFLDFQRWRLEKMYFIQKS